MASCRIPRLTNSATDAVEDLLTICSSASKSDVLFLVYLTSCLTLILSNTSFSFSTFLASCSPLNGIVRNSVIWYVGPFSDLSIHLAIAFTTAPGFSGGMGLHSTHQAAIVASFSLFEIQIESFYSLCHSLILSSRSTHSPVRLDDINCSDTLILPRFSKSLICLYFLFPTSKSSLLELESGHYLSLIHMHSTTFHWPLFPVTSRSLRFSSLLALVVIGRFNPFV